MKSATGDLWLVVYMTHSEYRAEAVEQMLQEEGFLVRRRTALGSGTYELRVLESEAQEARKLLMERGL